MPASRRRLAALTTALALAIAAPAGAQSAGDEQYQDPFAGQQGQGGGDSGSSGGGGGASSPAAGGGTSSPAGGGTSTPSSGPDAPVTSSDTTTSAPAPDQPAPAAAEQLPFTGAETGLVALGGAALLAGGVALRIRLREQR
jgi:hypothetical protein